MIITRVEIDKEKGLTMTLSITPNKDGMVDLGNNRMVHIDELKIAIAKHGISYVHFEEGKGQWNIGSKYSTEE